MHSVLLVEDDELLGRTICLALQKAGLLVFLATKGVDVWEALKAQQVNLILLDVMLPDEDGFSILSKLKASQEYKQIPVVMLTNMGESEHMAKARALGAKDYIIKANIEIDELVNKVKNDYVPA